MAPAPVAGETAVPPPAERVGSRERRERRGRLAPVRRRPRADEEDTGDDGTPAPAPGRLDVVA